MAIFVKILNINDAPKYFRANSTLIATMEFNHRDLAAFGAGVVEVRQTDNGIIFMLSDHKQIGWGVWFDAGDLAQMQTNAEERIEYTIKQFKRIANLK